jgi:hypothetical protein
VRSRIVALFEKANNIFPLPSTPFRCLITNSKTAPLNFGRYCWSPSATDFLSPKEREDSCARFTLPN